MNIRLVAFFALLPISLAATGPVISRYIPSFTSSSAQAAQLPLGRPTFSVMARNGHAYNASSLLSASREMYTFDGLMEMGGWYDLHELVASANESIPGFRTPFSRETGGDALASRQLLFGAQSSVSLYGLDLSVELPVSREIRFGLTLPLLHVEARQRYDFPAMAADKTMAFPQQEQTHRLRQALHQDLGMLQKDWIVNSIGDIAGWAECVKTWEYVWLLRTIQFGGRLGVSLPTAKTEDSAYPASFALGNPGSWGFDISLISRFEVKELIWFQSPLSLVVQTPSLRDQRLAAYSEPMQFGVLKGLVRTVPGITVSWEPSLTMQHFIDNVHLFCGISLVKHYADTLTDKRVSSLTPSYLTRTSVPTESADHYYDITTQREKIVRQRIEKKIATEWSRSYILLGVQYELADLFPRMKHVPMLNIGFNYCIGATRAAKMHQISAGISWRF